MGKKVSVPVIAATARPPSREEIEFMKTVAYPRLNETIDDRSLEKVCEALWNICLWEKQRADILDTKAKDLLGLSSLAAAVIAFGGNVVDPQVGTLLLVRAVPLILFIFAVILSIIALLGVKYGGFYDRDVFNALDAHRNPVGDLHPFSDLDPYRCFLRETSLQRWLVQRSFSNRNDIKYRRLLYAQIAALIATVSMLGVVVSVLCK